MLATQGRRVCVVTGGTSGIGREIVKSLCALGHHVLFVARDETRAEVLAKEMASSRAGAAGKCSFYLADLSETKCVADVASRIATDHGAIDTLVNNAGIGGADSRIVTNEGVELVWATNVLSYHLLSVLLSAPLSRSKMGGRIVNVSSDYAGGLDLQNTQLDKPGTFERHLSYTASKQANRMLAWALESKWGKNESLKHITINTMTPNLCDTSMPSELGFSVENSRSAAKGAETAIHLAISPDVATKSGLHWEDLKSSTCTFRNESQCDELLRIVEQLLENLGADDALRSLERPIWCDMQMV